MGTQKQVQQPDKQPGQNQGLQTLPWGRVRRIIYIVLLSLLFVAGMAIWILGQLDIIHVPWFSKLFAILAGLTAAIVALLTIAFLVIQIVRSFTSNEPKSPTVITLPSPTPPNDIQAPSTSTVLPLPPVLGVASDQPTSPSVPKAYYKLPPPRSEIFGRKKDIEDVLEALRSREQVISIEGMSGIGKTTLAIKIAHYCLSDPQAHAKFEAVVWVSAKDRPEQKLWLNEVLDATAYELGYLYSIKAGEALLLLQKHRTLIIIDNFDVIDDEELVKWLRHVPEPSRVLITTSRSQPVPWAWPVPLRGLEEPEELKLIRYHIQRLRLSDNIPEDILIELVKITKGNPLAIEVILSSVKSGRWSLREVTRHLSVGSETVEELLNNLFLHHWKNSMAREAKRVLRVVPFFVNLDSKEALGAAADLEGKYLDDALQQLVELSLLNTKGGSEAHSQQYDIHPLARSFAMARLRDAPKFEEQARLRWSKYYLDFAVRNLVREKPKERYWNSLVNHAILGIIDPEWSNLQQVLEWIDQKGQDQILVELMMLLVHYMDRRVRNAERIYYVQRAAAAAKKLGWKEDEVWFRIDALGWTFVEERRFADASREIEEGRRIAESIGNQDQTALAKTFLARVFLEKGEVEKASTLITEVDPTKCQPMIQHRAYMIAGDVARKKNDNLEAIRLYEKAQRVSLEYGGEGIDFESLRIGFAYLGNGDLEHAEHEFNEVGSGGERYGVTIEVMYSKYGLASVARARGERDKARQLAQEAKDELTRLDASHILLKQIDDFLRSLGAE